MKEKEFGSHVNEQLDLFLKDIDELNEDAEKAYMMIQQPISIKEMYIAREGGNRRFKYFTMTHLLHLFEPQFLMLNENWSSALLKQNECIELVTSTKLI